METMLGEVDRARGIYTHASQFCDPRKDEEFWQVWRGFEVQHGNEDTFRDMLRIKRSVQATYAQVHFNATDIAAEGGPEVLDPMAAAENALKSDQERKRAASQADGSAKRARTTIDAGTARKELISEFQPCDAFAGARRGFVFKMGVKGLGYYEDSSLEAMEARIRQQADEERRAEKAAALERRQAAAEANPEEIELDMDDEDDDAPTSAPAAPAAPAVVSNPEEIELDFEDLEEAPIPTALFGGSTLSNLAGELHAETAALPEPALMEEEEAAPDPKFSSLGALTKRAKKGGKGKGKA